MIPFDFEPTGNGLLDRLLTRLRNTLNSLAKVVTNDRLVAASLSTTPTMVFHGLKGPPVTWEVVGRNAGEVVYESTAQNDSRDRFLLLVATGPVDVTVRFS